MREDFGIFRQRGPFGISPGFEPVGQFSGVAIGLEPLEGEEEDRALPIRPIPRRPALILRPFKQPGVDFHHGFLFIGHRC